MVRDGSVRYGRRGCHGLDSLGAARGTVRIVVARAGRDAALAGPVDLLVLVPRDDVKVALVVRALVPADQAGVGQLGEILLDLGGSVLRTQNPQLTGDDRRVVAIAALVVGLSEQAEEGALGGQGDDGEGFGDEGFGLDGADPCQERSVPHSVADGRAPMAHRRS